MAWRLLCKAGGLLAVLALFWVACAASQSLAAPPPPNDDFANAQLINGALPTEVSTSNEGATAQAGEPGHPPAPGTGHSIWFRWEASRTEAVSVSVCGAAADPMVGVYVGDELGSLTEVARGTSSGEGCVLEGVPAAFEAVAGRVYSIQVDGTTFWGFSVPPGSGEGPIELRIRHQAPPANDDFANAQQVELGWSQQASNLGATVQPGEPAHPGDPGGASVWFKLFAPLTGGVAIHVDELPWENHSLVSVYTGSALGNLTEVPVAQIDGNGSDLLRVTAGTTYWISVSGKYDPVAETSWMGDAELWVGRDMKNDDFEDASGLSAGPMGGNMGSFGLTNVGATKQPGEPDHAGNSGGASVWFKWTASEDGSLGVGLCGSTFETLLAVYTGSSLGELAPVAAAKNTPSPPCQPLPGGSPQLKFNVTGGTTYDIAVDGYKGAEGGFGIELETSRHPVGPAPVSSPPSSSTKERLPIPHAKIVRTRVDSRLGLASFRLRSNDGTPHFLCQMDSGKFDRCHPTVVYRHLGRGRHIFKSKAVNSAGESDRTPAVFRFRIR